MSNLNGKRVTVIGLGNVGQAATSAMLNRRSCDSINLIDVKKGLQNSLVRDFKTAASIDSTISIEANDYATLHESDVIIIAAGVNEMQGGATDRLSKEGRLGLIDANVPVMSQIANHIADKAPNAIVVVVTNPPDPLADFLRPRITVKQVLSSGTLLDTMRLRGAISQTLNLVPSDIEATVIAEHGMSAVIQWSEAKVKGLRFEEYAANHNHEVNTLKSTIEKMVRSANLDIIQGLGASQYGIGVMVARIVEAILNDEKAVLPIGSYQEKGLLTYSLPSRVGQNGVEQVIMPELSESEHEGLNLSIEALQKAAKRVGEMA